MSKEYKKPDDKTLRNKLSKLQYRVTQHASTEPPFSNPYHRNKEEGIYVDIVTREPLFSSKDKYDAGCGWPSFTKPIEGTTLKEQADNLLARPRVEVRSQSGDSHLGHVFPDGPTEEGGLRYCINGAALVFIPKVDMKAEGYEAYLSLFK